MEARVALGVAVEAKRTKGHSAEARLFFEFSGRCVGGVFVLFDEATGESPLVGEGFVLTLNEKDAGRGVRTIKDDYIGSSIGAGVVVGVGHGVLVFARTLPYLARVGARIGTTEILGDVLIKPIVPLVINEEGITGSEVNCCGKLWLAPGIRYLEPGRT